MEISHTFNYWTCANCGTQVHDAETHMCIYGESALGGTYSVPVGYANSVFVDYKKELDKILAELEEIRQMLEELKKSF